MVRILYISSEHFFNDTKDTIRVKYASVLSSRDFAVEGRIRAGQARRNRPSTCLDPPPMLA